MSCSTTPHEQGNDGGREQLHQSTRRKVRAWLEQTENNSVKEVMDPFEQMIES